MIREPVDWLGSWYRYHGGAGTGTAQEHPRGQLRRVRRGLSRPEPQPPFAKIGRPSRFVAGKGGKPGVTHLFRYDDLAALVRFLDERFETEFELPRLKVSRDRDLTLPPALRARLEAERAAEFELYASLA